ncbi:hypothetical protein [Ferruginibacter sp. HRS2-29]|uniref:hypothetical protein n=1 Tax=Ferruginibacter sp. HRS2-29 TaxID=2487334 RepID=UPI0020CD6BC1|nr:hypothetical protein [Ferruginibacter sp. HRS2-29]MCP9751914.1 hypothetical protein [Ferruginibacter sp. HRS2-29]
MKKIALLVCLAFCVQHSFAQDKWFTLYTDSVGLVKDANTVSDLFIADIKKLAPDLKFNPTTILHTTPYLIYYDEREKTANIPLWEQVLPELKGFTYKVAGSEEGGRQMFGLFFNGFYLPHELGHGIQHFLGKSGISGSFDNEYLANTISMLFWKKHGRQKELDSCYAYAKTMYATLPNPVPTGKTIEAYFTENYEAATRDPFVYGYMQFGQFIKIYEDKSLPDFDGFVGKYLSGQ